MRKARFARIQRAGRPRKRSQEQNGCAAEMDAVAIDQMSRPNQQANAEQTEQHSENNAAGGTMSAGHQPDEKHDPERFGSNQQRSETRGNKLLRPNYAAVAAKQ